ncbi:hypothetical protein Tco_0857843 [Tanacetum coccineum]|uniref:Uncharacterized protein n=1 Tax=Tanacetum coccineum TaxID=301880 RepID=A0ABQ5BBA3_9ASTR
MMLGDDDGEVVALGEDGSSGGDMGDLKDGDEELLGDGASWSTFVEEGEPVDTPGTRVMTSGACKSTLGVGVSNSSNID